MEGQVGQAPRAQGLLGGLTCSTGTGTHPSPTPTASCAFYHFIFTGILSSTVWTKNRLREVARLPQATQQDGKRARF